MSRSPVICFLDSYTLSPGDLNLDVLDNVGTLTYYDRTPQDKIIERAQNAEVLITNKCQITAEIIDALPHLKMIQVAATGYNNIDLDTAKKRGVRVCNVSGYSTDSVAQHVFATLLNFYNKVSVYHQEVREGAWSKANDFSYWHKGIEALSDKTLGVIGYGQIGRKVAAIATAFGMRVVVSQRHDIKSDNDLISFHDQDFVFRNADILSLHVPLNKSTDKFINKASLDKMSADLILVNTGRGGLINEPDLATALKNKTIQAALLDVLSQEPPQADNALLSLPNCYITPHQAWANLSARRKLRDGIVSNIKAYLSGNPTNVIV